MRTADIKVFKKYEVDLQGTLFLVEVVRKGLHRPVKHAPRPGVNRDGILCTVLEPDGPGVASIKVACRNFIREWPGTVADWIMRDDEPHEYACCGGVGWHMGGCEGGPLALDEQLAEARRLK